MTLALALTGVVFFVLAMVMWILAAESGRRKTIEVCAGVGYAALGLAVVFFLASIWVHALT